MISVDAVASGNASASTTLTVAKTNAAGTKVLVVLIVAGGSGPATHDSVTYNGVAMTKRADIANANASGRNTIWTLSNPATGSAHDIVATFGGSCASYLAGISLLGADATSPIDATNTQAGVIDSSITTVKGGSLILNVTRVHRSSGVDSPVVAHSETEHLNQILPLATVDWICVASKLIAVPGSTATGWSIGSHQSTEEAVAMISIAPEPTSRTVTAKARIKNTATKTVTAKAAVKQLGVTKTIRAGATIKKLGVTRTITARGKIGTTITRTITGRAYIAIPPRGHWRLRSKDDTYPVAMKDDRIKL